MGKKMLALSVCFPQPCSPERGRRFADQDDVYITPDELFRFHNNEFDEMPCKPDSTENPLSFKKYPTLL